MSLKFKLMDDMKLSSLALHLLLPAAQIKEIILQNPHSAEPKSDFKPHPPQGREGIKIHIFGGKRTQKGQ